MLIAANVMSGLLALAFLGGGLGKLTRAKSQVATAERLHIRWHRYRLIAIPELAASAGLMLGLGIARLGAAAAIGLGLLMCGAIVFRIRARDRAAFVAGDTLFAVAAIATAVLRLASA